eukprot:1339066-Prymnesium_polylepis.1
MYHHPLWPARARTAPRPAAAPDDRPLAPAYAGRYTGEGGVAYVPGTCTRLWSTVRVPDMRPPDTTSQQPDRYTLG